jgi:hypothetical protein
MILSTAPRRRPSFWMSFLPSIEFSSGKVNTC